MLLNNVVNAFLAISYKHHLVISFCVRLLLIIYSEYHDRVSEVPFTDIDYKVFTDAARHVSLYNSPYERHTYRYSPIIAFLLVPNVIIQFSFGKILFSLIDLVVGILIYKIVKENFTRYCNVTIGNDEIENEKYTTEQNQVAIQAMLFWLYNPFSIIISTRGNADSLASFCVLLTLYYLQKNNFFIAGLLHGLAIHIRLYPIIFSLAMFMHLNDFNNGTLNCTIPCKVYSDNRICLPNDSKKVTDENQLSIMKPEKRTIFKKKYLLYLVPNCSQIYLIAGTIISLVFFTILFYLMYGYTFLYETYIYHLVRKDSRHNFSVFFYIIYLTADIKNIGVWQKVLTILPNIVLLIVASVKYGLHKQSLCFALFIETFLMVTYNAVMTSQYFIWFISILPLFLWQLKISFYNWFKLFAIWGIAQLAWLLPAYMLEFQGKNTFLMIWLQSVAFFSANIIILGRLIKNFSPNPDTKFLYLFCKAD